MLAAVFIQNCGHGGTAYYIYSQRHYLSYAPALSKFIFYSFRIIIILYLMHCNELYLYIVYAMFCGSTNSPLTSKHISMFV